MDAERPEKSDRFAIFNRFIDAGQAHLRKLRCGSAAQLWTTLWRWGRPGTDSVCVGLNALAAAYGTDKRNVARMLGQLETHGYLVTLAPGKQGRGSCATYRLTVPPEKVSPAHHSERGKGVASTPLTDPEGGGPVVTKKVSPERGKGVTSTPVQKQKKNTPGGSRGGGKKAAKKRAGPNPLHQPAVAAFCEAWAAKYGRPYVFAGGKDADAVRFLLGAVGNDPDAFKAMVARYLADGDQFVTRNAHNLGTLRLKVNTWLAPPAAPAGPAADEPRQRERRHYLDQLKLGELTRERAEELFGGPLDG